jgi:hypothetical protein
MRNVSSSPLRSLCRSEQLAPTVNVRSFLLS